MKVIDMDLKLTIGLILTTVLISACVGGSLTTVTWEGTIVSGDDFGDCTDYLYLTNDTGSIQVRNVDENYLDHKLRVTGEIITPVCEAICLCDEHLYAHNVQVLEEPSESETETISVGERLYGATLKQIGEDDVTFDISYDPGPPCEPVSETNYNLTLGDNIDVEDGVRATLIGISSTEATFSIEHLATICV